MTFCSLSEKRCTACEGSSLKLSQQRSHELLQQLDGWRQTNHSIEKTFVFTGHYEAMAFVNAVAWVSHRENHHPDLALGYKDVRVRYWTHAIDGLSENDFICAAKIERLLEI